MRVLMLGWEFPPFISGGLGTACHGLTSALSKKHTDVAFVLPRQVDSEATTHVRLLSAAGYRPRQGGGGQVADSLPVSSWANPSTPHLSLQTVPAKLVSVYQSAGGRMHAAVDTTGVVHEAGASEHQPINILDLPQSHPRGEAGGEPYAGDLLQEIERYAHLCVRLARSEPFDVVHAHDWVTYPAGLAVARATGKPLVVHVHSTEFDRSGEKVNQPVYDIERAGMHGADRVIAVSYLTRSIVQHRYGIDPSRIDVVYNGIDNGKYEDYRPRTTIRRGDRVVLFLGRITMQKGPEYFVAAAKRVLEKMGRVKFVMAGSGDMTRRIIELAAAEGIGHKILFTGFLRGKDVERIFRMADVYVMPSVSEPFGIAPLEAISHDVPVIISKTSGVSEVLTHALKVDFWDVDEIANKIIAVLRHPPLSSTLRQFAEIDARRLTWDDAADKCLSTYQRAMDQVAAGR